MEGELREEGDRDAAALESHDLFVSVAESTGSWPKSSLPPRLPFSPSNTCIAQRTAAEPQRQDARVLTECFVWDSSVRCH